MKTSITINGVRFLKHGIEDAGGNYYPASTGLFFSENSSCKAKPVRFNEAVRKMVREWLTGNDERDAQVLRRKFRATRMTIEQWRQVIAETKAAPA